MAGKGTVEATQEPEAAAEAEPAPPQAPPPEIVVHAPVMTAVAQLRAHPRNYRLHPDDQLEHLGQSLEENGMYRNVVAAEDGTILAGHGVVEAAVRRGLTEVPVIRLPIRPTSPQAKKILTGDNELGRLGVVDDRALTTLLQEIQAETEGDLLGTGFDDMMLANLVFVTRREDEVRTVHDASAAWVGMPEWERNTKPRQLILSFETDEAREELIKQLGLVVGSKTRQTWSAWYPPRERGDVSSLVWEDAGLDGAGIPTTGGPVDATDA